jgi:hypothetical protein
LPPVPPNRFGTPFMLYSRYRSNVIDLTDYARATGEFCTWCTFEATARILLLTASISRCCSTEHATHLILLVFLAPFPLMFLMSLRASHVVRRSPLVSVGCKSRVGGCPLQFLCSTLQIYSAINTSNRYCVEHKCSSARHRSLCRFSWLPTPTSVRERGYGPRSSHKIQAYGRSTTHRRLYVFPQPSDRCFSY